MVNIEVVQNIIGNSKKLFTVLSRSDNLKIFSAAQDGLKISTSILNRLDISRKRYYRALKQLKESGLIEKDKEGSYIHTTFGSIIYQRNVLQTAQYMKELEKMQMIDTLRRAEFSEESIAKFAQIIDSSVNSTASPSFLSSSTISNTLNSITHAIPNASIILSYDKVIQLLTERIKNCKSEILITTRICPEILINEILEKSKLGVKVKVVADIELVKEYFKSQEKFIADDDNTLKLQNINNMSKITQQQERKCVVANPWYPDTTINRRISDIPFGMIILDNNEVGIELVNSNSPKEFFAAIWVKDEKFAMMIKDFYQTIWNKGSENINITK